MTALLSLVFVIVYPILTYFIGFYLGKHYPHQRTQALPLTKKRSKKYVNWEKPSVDIKSDNLQSLKDQEEAMQAMFLHNNIYGQSN